MSWASCRPKREQSCAFISWSYSYLPAQRMSVMVSDVVAWSSRRKLPYIPRCLPGPRQAEEGVKRCRM